MRLADSSQQFYNVAEAAQLLRKSEKAIRRLIDRGEILAHRVGKRQILIARRAIEAFLRGTRAPSRAKESAMVKSRRYKRGGWEYDINIPEWNIRERRVAPGAKTAREAETFGRQRLAELLLEMADSQPELGKEVAPTLEKFWPRFLEEYCEAEGHKPSGIERKTTSYRRWLRPLLGKKRLDEIGRSDAQRLKAAMRKKGRKSSTINNVLTLLNTILEAAETLDVIPQAPKKFRLLPRNDEKVREEFTDQEVEKLLATAASYPADHRMVQMLKATALGGRQAFRQGEVIALRRRDVDFDADKIHVRRSDWRGKEGPPKNGRAQALPLVREVRRLLEPVRFQKPDEYVVVGRDGGKVNYETFRDWWRLLCKRAGIEDRGFHQLRHHVGTKLGREGASPLGIKEFMRHSTLKMTERYMHGTTADAREAVRVGFGDGLETGSLPKRKEV